MVKRNPRSDIALLWILLFKDSFETKGQPKRRIQMITEQCIMWCETFASSGAGEFIQNRPE